MHLSDEARTSGPRMSGQPEPGPRASNRRPSAARTAGAADLVPVRPRRRPWLIASGALVASVGALGVVWLVGAASDREEVLAVRQPVPYGQVLQPSDLAVVRVSVDPGVDTLPAGARATVVGQAAATALAPGMLLAPGMVSPLGEPAAGRVLVPLAIPAERMPAQGLRAGDRILAVSTQAVSAEGGDVDAVLGAGAAGPDGCPAGPPGTTLATVVRVGPADVNGVTVVDVTTAPAAGPGLAAASAAGQVAVVVQPSEG